jgi:predicted nucleic acid-binding Zn ribbon protein
MKKCQICERTIEDFDEICPYCENSEDIAAEIKKRKKLCLFTFILVLLVLFLAAPLIYIIYP